MWAELVVLDCAGRLLEKLTHYLRRSEIELTNVQFVEPPANCIDGVYFDSFAETGFVADEPPQVVAQRIRQGVGKGGE